jgi:hypothetical protein
MIQYKMPDAYDVDGVINQEKRFSVAKQRYRLVLSILKHNTCRGGCKILARGVSNQIAIVYQV